MRLLCLAPLLLLIAAAPPQRYTLDPGASEVSARVAFFGLTSKTARFPDVTGAVTLDPADRGRIDLAVVMNATALTAPDAVTLARLRGPQFFDVARYPTIRFAGRAIRMTGDRDALIYGDITARGITRPATLNVRFAAPPFAAGAGAPLALDGRTMIDRRDFGMTAYPLVVGRKVTIRIRARFAPG